MSAPPVPQPLPPAAAPSAQTLLSEGRIWQASGLGRSNTPCLGSGFAALDALLPGGGWPTRALIEILQPEGSHAEWRLLAPALSRLLCPPTGKQPSGSPSPERAARRPAGRRHSAPARGMPAPLLLINPPHQPHLPGLQALGLPGEQLVWVRTGSGREGLRQALWATEQAIKAQATCAVLSWLPQARPEQIRRLQALALNSPAPVFLVREQASAAQSSAAPLRLLLQSPPGPGLGPLSVRVLKRRGPAHEEALLLPNSWPATLLLNLPERLRRPNSAPALPTLVPASTPRSTPVEPLDHGTPALARPAAWLQ